MVRARYYAIVLHTMCVPEIFLYTSFKMITRKQLESFTLAKLQEELLRFGISNPPVEHTTCFDLLLDLWKGKISHGDTSEFQALEAEGNANSPSSTAAQPSFEGNNTLLKQTSNNESHKSSTESGLPHFCEMMFKQMQLQQQAQQQIQLQIKEQQELSL